MLYSCSRQPWGHMRRQLAHNIQLEMKGHTPLLSYVIRVNHQCNVSAVSLNPSLAVAGSSEVLDGQSTVQSWQPWERAPLAC